MYSSGGTFAQEGVLDEKENLLKRILYVKFVRGLYNSCSILPCYKNVHYHMESSVGFPKIC